MSEPQFFQTPMGRTFFDHTMPKLVAAVELLAERMVPDTTSPVDPHTGASDDEKRGSARVIAALKADIVERISITPEHELMREINAIFCQMKTGRHPGRLGWANVAAIATLCAEVLYEPSTAAHHHHEFVNGESFEVINLVCEVVNKAKIGGPSGVTPVHALTRLDQLRSDINNSDTPEGYRAAWLELAALALAILKEHDRIQPRD